MAQELYPFLKARSYREWERQRDKKGVAVYHAGRPVLIHRDAKDKSHTAWKMAHVLMPLDQGKVLTGHGGRITIEHVKNLVPVTCEEPMGSGQLPNRSGQRIWVKMVPQDLKEEGRGRPTLERQLQRKMQSRWFSGLVLWQDKNGKISIRWDREAGAQKLKSIEQVAQWKDTDKISLSAVKWLDGNNHCIWGLTDEECQAAFQRCQKEPGRGLAEYTTEPMLRSLTPIVQEPRWMLGLPEGVEEVVGLPAGQWVDMVAAPKPVVANELPLELMGAEMAE